MYGNLFFSVESLTNSSIFLMHSGTGVMKLQKFVYGTKRVTVSIRTHVFRQGWIGKRPLGDFSWNLYPTHPWLSQSYVSFYWVTTLTTCFKASLLVSSFWPERRKQVKSIIGTTAVSFPKRCCYEEETKVSSAKSFLPTVTRPKTFPPH